MQPTIEILAKINQNSSKNRDEIFTRLFRYLLRPDIYFVAYKNLYANNGAATKGVDNDTADGFSEEKINKIIQSLAKETYTPKPVRRTYIDKGNGKKRPLGIPTFTDKLIQEVLRMILEAIYEPVFLDCAHGFRSKRSCHTALKSAKGQFNGARWFIEGDIRGCFDNIDHSALIEFITNKIKDARLIKLLYKFLKAGYVENWQYYSTYSGTPQGGIISPILSNIYLNELDKFAMKLKTEFDEPSTQKFTTEYKAAANKVKALKQKIGKVSESDKSELLRQLKEARAIMLATPCKLQADKKLAYIRYADDFLISVNGDHQECQLIKDKLAAFIADTLKMELSDEKTLITHSSQKARFLGYNVSVRRDGQIRPAGTYTRRTLSNNVELTISLDEKISKFLFEKGVVIQKNGEMFPVSRTKLLHLADLEIVTTFNAELRGICNYYSLASNYSRLHYFAYLMEYSCLKTLADKHRSSIGKIKTLYRNGAGSWGVSYETASGRKCMCFADYMSCKENANCFDNITKVETINRYTQNSFEKRLKAKVCELCGSTESKHYQIHHVNKLKNLNGKAEWEKAMIAKWRKTMVVCLECHNHIHHQ